MSDNGGNAHEALAQVLIAEVLQRYRVDLEDARAVVFSMLEKDRRISDLLRSGVPLREIQRRKAYQVLRHAVKKRIYYRLRRYKPENDFFEEKLAALESAKAPALAGAIAIELAALHASTRGRLATKDEFHRELFARIGSPRTILDAGCGVYPLLFPWEGSSAKLYLAIDKDRSVIRAVNAFAARCAPGRLLGYCRDIGDWLPILSAHRRFDLCFMFQLVPVVERQDKNLLANLARVPADRLVVTGSKMALAKKRTIEKRERASLLRFAEQARRSVSSEWLAGEEICLLLE